MRTRIVAMTAFGILGLGCSGAPARPPPRREYVARRPVESAPKPPDPPKPPSTEVVCQRGTLAECRERCAEGDAKGCKAFGERICKEGSVVECQAACDADNAAACAGLADLYKSGRLERNEARRLDLLTRACHLGDLESCSVAADRYYALATTIGDLSPPLTREVARTRTVELFRTVCERRLAAMGTTDPATGSEPWTYMSAAGVSGYWRCPGSWARHGAADASCSTFEGTACDMLAGVDPSSHAMLAAACEADEWMACRALAREETLPHTAPAYVLALRKLCEHYTAAGNHGADYCGRLKDLGLGHETPH